MLPPAWVLDRHGTEPLIDALRTLADPWGRLPPWTLWWPGHEVSAPFGDSASRARVEREQTRQPRLPLSYFEHSPAVPAGWDDPPAGCLSCGDTYAPEW